jgi:hypothetical protein
VEPGGLAVLPGGALLVADRAGAGGGGLWRVDPVTGAVVAVAVGGALRGARGVALAPDGGALVTVDQAGGPALVRVDLASGAASVVAAGGLLRRPRGVALASDGRALVADAGAGAVLAVDPSTRAVTALGTGPVLAGATGIAVVRPDPSAPAVPAPDHPAPVPAAPAGAPPPAVPGPAPGPPPPPAPQDRPALPAEPAAADASAAAPVAAAALGPVRLRPSTFRAARSGAGIAAATGTTVSFTSSGPARVTFTVHRLSRVRCRARGGRARGRGCLKDVRLRGKWVRRRWRARTAAGSQDACAAGRCLPAATGST